MKTAYLFLSSTLQPGDVTGFTFFVGLMAMFAASVFFFFERSNVDGKWKTSLLVSGLITMIAAAHYYYMRDFYLAAVANNLVEGATYINPSPTQFRYIDWTLTVPLMCVEFFLLLRPYGAKQSLLWKMIGYSVLMLVAGYIGEAIQPEQTILWGIISTVGWAGIVYEATAGSVAKMAQASGDANLQKAIRLLRNFVLVGWAIYPIGYMLMPGNLMAGFAGTLNIDLLYNLGDAVNKIGFGLVVYQMAVSSSAKKATA
ncbi:MAG: bacteriorhodopsin-like [Sphingobacteriaceae bacterium]|jgi:sensory rhodopsin|nr:bacteriorhodopsin-like [Sphingobacteriaceae bacterium]